VKLAPILLKYLAIHKQLDLPGLGTFLSDQNDDPNVDFTKRDDILTNLRFEERKITTIDDSLVEFISKETGKMKVLAISDIQSQLDDMLYYLHTGKQFNLQGFGLLSPHPDGSISFSREKQFPDDKKKETTTTYLQPQHLPNQFAKEKNARNQRGKPTIIILTLALIAIAATTWYYVQSNSSREGDEVPSETVKAEPAPDTSKPEAPATPVVTKTPSDHYTYLLEIAAKPRAIKRYTQLKTLNWPVELVTKDSITFRLIMRLPVAGADTTRIKDSLTILSGRKVVISPE
jgi:hypothetical protein